MSSKRYDVIGVMSGTSLDGIDLSSIEFILKNNRWSYHFKAVDTFCYSDNWVSRLAGADCYSNKELQALNDAYTPYLAKKINSFIQFHQLNQIDEICSHGHTILHQPEKQITLQIGNQPQLSDLLQQKVVCDFRIQDVKSGGQGAPLVPIGDQLLFPDYTACINLGGFANISLQKGKRRIAFDICPVNTVLNRYAEKFGKTFDDKGMLAQTGTVNESLLDRLNDLSFYQQQPPKSLGIEWVKRVILPILEESHQPPDTILATYTKHIAFQLFRAIPSAKNGKVLLTGGGVYNDFLVKSLQKLTKLDLVIPDKNLIDYKEALIFGLLGVLRLRGENNVLSSVTGAKKDHSSGFIYSPTKF